MLETITAEPKDKSTQLDPIIEWANSRPHWEKYIWKHCLSQGNVSEDQMKEAYRLFKIENAILPKEEFEEIDLSKLSPPQLKSEDKRPLAAIRSINNVNALPDGIGIEFGSKLTVCYGMNGSGKSGYGRIIASACFTRGDGRSIYPNLKAEIVSTEPAQAEFVIGSGNDEEIISHTDGGQSNPTLKRFSMFDSHSARIQLDNENTLNFTPAQLAVFDDVNQLVKSMEVKLEEEKAKGRTENPLSNSFLGTSSVVSEALLVPELEKQDEEILSYTEFPENGEKTIEELKKKKESLVKKNIEAEKKKLNDDRATIDRFKKELDAFIVNSNDDSKEALNGLINDVKDKQKLVEELGVQTFDDGIFESTGSEKWKSLLRAAKELYDHEVELKGQAVQLEECLLCHQPLSSKEKNLFADYWKFLQSTAEGDLKKAQDALLKEEKRIELTRLKPPRVDEGEAVIKIFTEIGAQPFITELREYLEKVDSTLIGWNEGINALSEVNNDKIPELQTSKIDLIIKGIDDKIAGLKDPKEEIETITKKVTELEHRKIASKISEQYKKYLQWQRWYAKASKVSMSGTKYSYTEERSKLFQEIVTDEYVQILNEECNALKTNVDLRVTQRGSDGKTLVSKKLGFSRDKKPSRILSEGEQKACSIADFLSEIRLDPGNWGIILDDPVNSLDHERKELIAKRLVKESESRQVIVFSHDIMFVSMLAKHAYENSVELKSNWIRKLSDGTPGQVEKDTSPKLSNLASLKTHANKAVEDYEKLGPKEQEKAVGVALDYLRSACEALVREHLFAGAVQRYEDHVRIQNLEEVPFNREMGLKLVELHREISELGVMHDRSDEMRENLVGIDEYNKVRGKFEALETETKKALNEAKKEREVRRKDKKASTAGWG